MTYSNPPSSMQPALLKQADGRNAWYWPLLCAAMVVVMGILRLGIFPNQIPLTDALPLLVCLWNRNVRLLWGMAAAFILMMGYKVGGLLANPDVAPHMDILFGAMHATNIVVVAAVIHAIVRLTERLETTVATLERTNTELEASNEELAAREEEITQQNEELQSQAEELEQQTEELNTQTEELQSLNEQLAARERALSDMLETSASDASEAEMRVALGENLMRLLAGRTCSAALLEPKGTEFIVRPLVGLSGKPQSLRRDRTLAELILSRDRAGFLADLSLRPDLDVPALAGGVMPRSLAAAPVRLGDTVAGALEVYSQDTGDWSEHELRLIQWLADQCGRTWTTARLRESLDDHRRLLRMVTDTSTVGLFMTNEDGVCTYLNPAARRLTGYSLNELSTRPLHEIIRMPDENGRKLPFDVYGVSEEEPSVELRDDCIVRKDGETVPVMLTATQVVAGDRKSAAVIEIRDMTEERRRAQEREQLLESERAARADAERANRAKDEFVATLSHELRTPLNAVLGWAALLGRTGCDNAEEVSKGVEVIERNARHQSQLISDLLDISRITAGKIRLDVQSVDLPLVVQNAIDSVRPAADAKNVNLARVIETIDRVVMGDPNRLQQVIWNLLSNAIKFTPRGGSVQIVLSRVASYVQITVSDTGEGIDPEHMPNLFERYRQADASSTRRHGGLGLGLAIAKHLVELHGGTIQARSEGLGKGSAFSVLLPVRATDPPSSVEGPHPLTHRAMQIDDSTPMLDGLSILVVDDDEDARELIGRILQDRGAEVTPVASGEEALKFIGESRPNLLISDVGMPGMDGYTLIRTVRERWPETFQQMPAIALTAFARSEDRTKALLAGFQSHIAKPVESAELVATVASLRYSIANSRLHGPAHQPRSME